MSTNPTTRIAERRRFIAERTANLRAELDAFAAEATELDVAERVLKRFSEPASIGGHAETAPALTTPAPAPNGVDEADPPTLPQMVFIILKEAMAEGRKGVDSAEIVSTIRSRWKPHFTANNVRPTLWRMVKKEDRLRKRGKIYSIPTTSSPEGETGVVGTPARH